METLIKQAIEKYKAHEAVCEAEQKARQQADQEATEKEREELRQFLATLMPEELVQYANLSNYRLEQAKRNGARISVEAPGCFPVQFRVNVWQNEFTLVNASANSQYHVPTLAQVRSDECDGYYIQFDGGELFGDFMTALGYAAVLGPELIPLQAEIEACEEGDKINNEYVREAEAGLREMQEKRTPQERIADALENIANGIAALHLYGA